MPGIGRRRRDRGKMLCLPLTGDGRLAEPFRRSREWRGCHGLSTGACGSGVYSGTMAWR